jgi:hypothetical protein
LVLKKGTYIASTGGSVRRLKLPTIVRRIAAERRVARRL